MNKFYSRLGWFVFGVITGVVGVFVYQVFGKPVEPEPKFPTPTWTWEEWHREWSKMLDLRDKQILAQDDTQPIYTGGD